VADADILNRDRQLSALGWTVKDQGYHQHTEPGPNTQCQLIV